MNRRFAKLLLVAVLLLPQAVLAEPDYYYGDSAIYVGGTTNSAPVNILIFIDSSKQMGETGTTGTYEPGEGSESGGYYAGSYSVDAIYYRNNDVYQVVSNTDMAEVQSGYPDAYDLLSENGNFIGCINSSGEVCNNKTVDYYSGDYLNWKETALGAASEWTASTAYAQGDLVYAKGADSSSRQFKCISAGTSGATIADPFPDTVDLEDTYADGTVVWEPQETLIEAVAEELNNDIFPFLADTKGAHVGLMEYNSNDQGGAIVLPVAENTADALTAAMNTSIVPITQTANAQPLGSAMWDAWLYWVGDPTGSSHANSTSNDNAAYSDSPIEYWCQNNHMIVLATGATKDNLGASNPVAAMDDGDDYYAPEAASYLYNNLDYEIDGIQAKVKTHVLQLLTPELSQMRQTAEGYGGGGIYVNVAEVSELKKAIVDIVLAILEENSSFVAPVVPASPENRTYSGQRIYLGFFKPMNDEPWYGNLKKFGLNYDNQIVAYDSSSDLTEATDSDGYFLVDDSTDPATPLHRSFWTPSGTLDGGDVNAGGVGGLLKTRSSARNIYTYLGTESDLTDTANAFTTGNTPLKAYLVGDDDTEKNETINFIHGYKSDGATKRNWLLGDILHSKPLIVNYANYSFSEANEADATKNKSMIFFGANDGMLHAINDYNGEEAWAFIPPELLDDLHYLKTNENHYYFVDNSPLAYVYDADGDGTIESGDKVILIFGLRRGGGSSTLGTGTRGSYYAIDVTTPSQPEFLWQINNQTTGFSEMGETWSQPRLAKMNIGGVRKIVAVFGAGYDNNEDLRYGNIQTFPDDTDGSTDTSAASDGYESALSTGTSSQYQPKGRGLYVVEVAQLNESGGVYTPDFTNSGSKIWSAVWGASNVNGNTEDTVSTMTYSIPSDVLVFDRDHDGFYDRFYVGDTGGQLWRFTVGDSSTANWKADRIFIANDTVNSTDLGRKIFYKPTVTYEYPDTFIYFGTGDREHPLNYLNPGDPGGAVLDRFYMVRDRENDDNPAAPANQATPAPLDESNLVDVTTNQLQRDDTSASTISELLTRLFDFEPTDPTWDDRYGWFIKMNGNDGEKVLAPPTVFADVAFFTTYTPNDASVAPSDPCVGGNLGVSRLYAVNARTGEAVYNWWSSTSDDEFGETQSSANSQRAQGGTDDGSYVLRRADRSLAIGEGIPSGLVIVISKDGSTSILVGSGGAFPNVELDQIETVYPLYWMTW